MTSLGACIKFCTQLNSFQYQEEGYFKDGIRWIEYQKVEVPK